MSDEFQNNRKTLQPKKVTSYNSLAMLLNGSLVKSILFELEFEASSNSFI